MLNLQQLKAKQKEYLQNNDLKNLNKINKMLFELREQQRKTKEQAREQAREKRLSAKICSFCEKMLSVENERDL